MMTQKKWQFMDWANYAINVEAKVITPENAQLKAKGKGAKEEGRVQRKAKAKVLTSKEQKVKERQKAVMAKEKAKGKHRRMEDAGHVDDHIST